MNLKIHTDGGARGNPGKAAVGVVIEADGKEIDSFGAYIGIATNNEAEYQGVIHALGRVKSRWLIGRPLGDKISSIEFYLDSLLVVNQLNGLWKLKKAHLKELLLNIRMLEQDIGIAPVYKHVPREENSDADALVNQTLDAL